jgi:hypothetical protein
MPKTKAWTKTNLTETVMQASGLKVDREKGYIYNVKILGKDSLNNRRYSDPACDQAAVCYEGIGVNTNHPDAEAATRPRTIQEGIGWLENIQVKKDGVYGDLGIFKEDPQSGKIFEAAERRPDRFGLSHNAEGQVNHSGGEDVVEAIDSVRSVDLVQRPATTKGLFESVTDDVELIEEPQIMVVKKYKFKKLVEALSKSLTIRAGLLALLEDDMTPAGFTADTPVSVPQDAAAPSSDEAARAAFKAAIVAVLDDDTLSWEDTQSKIEQLVSSLQSMTETPSVDDGSGDGSEGADESAIPEGKRPVKTKAGNSELIESNKRISALEGIIAKNLASDAARKTIVANKVTLTEERVETLAAIPDAKIRTRMLEDWKKIDKVTAKPVPKSRRNDDDFNAVALEEEFDEDSLDDDFEPAPRPQQRRGKRPVNSPPALLEAEGDDVQGSASKDAADFMKRINRTVSAQ